ERHMASLNAEKAELETALSEPLAPADIAQAGRRLKAVLDALETEEMRWLELSEQIEQASADGHQATPE
ncbi:MAG: hypothetical protein PHQ87_06945, partial [Hydrogenophaga sp.]